MDARQTNHFAAPPATAVLPLPAWASPPIDLDGMDAPLLAGWINTQLATGNVNSVELFLAPGGGSLNAVVWRFA